MAYETQINTVMHGYDVPVDGTVTTASLHAVLDGYAALREWAIELERRLKKRQSNV